MKYDPKTVRNFAESLATEKLPLPLVDKEIWISYILREIHALPDAKHLAFKGGTCLVKAYYGYYRFSEDVDLTWTGGKIKERDFRSRVIQPVMKELGLNWYKDENVKAGLAGSQSGKIMSYFLRSPEPSGESTKLKITVAFNEKLEFPTQEIKLKGISSEKRTDLEALYGDVAADYFKTPKLTCYSIQEITCEKIRALLTRKAQLVRSRDIVDLYVISQRQGGLENVAPPQQVKAKILAALRIPSYKTEYERATNNLYDHLQRLVEQASQDPVFLDLPEETRLSKFAVELGDYLIDNNIAETRSLRRGLSKSAKSSGLKDGL